MIQRIQTIFLMLNDIVFIALFFVPFMSLADAKGPQFALEFSLSDYSLALVGEIAIVVLAGFAMVLFKNRKLQMKLCTVGIVLSVLNSALLAYIPMMLNGSGSVDAKYVMEAGMYVSLAHIVLFLLARIYISKDEALVNSMDRLR